jgi:hypothetical protein
MTSRTPGARIGEMSRSYMALIAGLVAGLMSRPSLAAEHECAGIYKPECEGQRRRGHRREGLT